MIRRNNFNNRTLFALPYLIFMSVFVVAPLFMLLFYAFFDKGFSFAAVAEFFENADKTATIWRSLKIAFMAAVLCLLIGYPIAFIISKMKSRTAQTVVLMTLIAPMWINGLLRTIALKDLATVLDIPMGTFLLVIGLTIDYLPFMIMPIYLVLSGINKQFYEVSADLGATPAVTFFKVVVPLSASGIISGFLMVFTPAVSTYYMSEYLGGNETFMIGEALNRIMTQNTYDKSEAAVIALILLGIVGISVLLTNRLSRIGNKKGGMY